MKTSNQFTLGFRQVKRSPVNARHGTGEEHSESDHHKRIMEDKPVSEQTGLGVSDRHQVHRADQANGDKSGQTKRHFVTHHLSSFTHTAKQRPLRARTVPSQNHAEHFEPQNRKHEKHGDVRDVCCPATRKRQSNERCEACREA